MKAIVSPLKVDISAITMEYGLYNQRFWLPRTQALEGEAQVMFMQGARHGGAEVHLRERQRARGAAADSRRGPSRRVAFLRDSLDSARTARTLRDSLVREAVRARGKEIAAQRERDCAATGTYNTVQRRYEGTLSVAMRVPCDSAKLANSPDLPPSIYDKGDEVFGTARARRAAQGALVHVAARVGSAASHGRLGPLEDALQPRRGHLDGLSPLERARPAATPRRSARAVRLRTVS